MGRITQTLNRRATLEKRTELIRASLLKLTIELQKVEDELRRMDAQRSAFRAALGRLAAICIVDQTGRIEREGVVASNPEAIAAFIKSHAPHVARIGLETGTTSTLAMDRAE